MALVTLIEYEAASAEVKSVYDDIMKTRGVDWVNNFWKALANDPALLARTWAQVKQVMASGALDALAKEMIYVAVSVSASGLVVRPENDTARRAVGGWK